MLHQSKDRRLGGFLIGYELAFTLDLYENIMCRDLLTVLGQGLESLHPHTIL